MAGALNVGSAFATFSLKLDGVQKSARKATAAMGRIEKKSKKMATTTAASMKRASKSVEGFANKAKSIGKAGAVIGVAIGLIGKSAISMASDMEETQQKFDVTFASIKDESNATAKQMSKDFGTSELAMKTMLSGTGDMMSGMGIAQDKAFRLSTEVAALGADLASFANYAGGAEGATEALTKGLLGQRDMMQSLGIVIMEEDVKARVKAIKKKKEFLGLSERELRMEATLMMAKEQSKNAIGDFARSRDSFANQQRILTAELHNTNVELGKVFLPIMTSLVSKLIPIISAMAEWIEKHPVMTKIIIISTVALTGLMLIIGLLGVVIAPLTAAFALLGTTVAIATAPVWLIIVAIIALVVLMGILWAKSDEIVGGLKVLWEDWSERISNMMTSLGETLIWVWNNFKEGMLSIWDRMKQGAIEKMNGLRDGVTNALNSLVEGMKTVGSNIITGLWDGLQEKIAWIKGKVQGFVDGIKKLFSGVKGFDVSSPSKVMKEIGNHVSEGLAIGITQRSGMVEDAASGVVNSTININNNNSLSDGMDANMLAERMAFQINNTR